MNRRELYYETVAKMIRFFWQGELKHASCAACMIGNMIADKKGYIILNSRRQWVDPVTKEARYPVWTHIFVTSSLKEPNISELSNFKDSKMLDPSIREAVLELSDLGYTIAELARIEYAFEKVSFNKSAVDNRWYLGSPRELANDFPEVDDDISPGELEELGVNFNSEDHILAGMLSVLDELALIHEINEEEANQSKENFSVDWSKPLLPSLVT